MPEIVPDKIIMIDQATPMIETECFYFIASGLYQRCMEVSNYDTICFNEKLLFLFTTEKDAKTIGVYGNIHKLLYLMSVQLKSSYTRSLVVRMFQGRREYWISCDEFDKLCDNIVGKVKRLQVLQPSKSR